MPIRKIKEDDLHAITTIEAASQAVPWTDAIFKDCFHAGYPGWVLEEEGKVLGFVLISIRADECHLLNIGVHPGRHRQGFGTQLLQYAIGAAKNLGALMIYLEVRETNTRALALYKKMHFSQIGVRKDYYPAFEGREDGLVFALDLTNPP